MANTLLKIINKKHWTFEKRKCSNCLFSPAGNRAPLRFLDSVFTWARETATGEWDF